jgi:dTDP-4-dehydrorhamnose reductase
VNRQINVVVFGASGMLGNVVCMMLTKMANVTIKGTIRSESRTHWRNSLVQYLDFDSNHRSHNSISELLLGADFAINCVGLIPHKNSGKNQVHFKETNTDFAIDLAIACKQIGVRLIHVSTDCVFSGSRGAYLETDPKDSNEAYGQSKALADDGIGDAVVLRTSVIGCSPVAGPSLLDWFLASPKDADVDGYTNHYWNGITNLAFGKIVGGLLRHSDLVTSMVQHVTPLDFVTKYELLSLSSKYFNRSDLRIRAIENSKKVDRTLATIDPSRNEEIWRAAGYNKVPTIEMLVRELAQEDWRQQ